MKKIGLIIIVLFIFNAFGNNFEKVKNEFEAKKYKSVLEQTKEISIFQASEKEQIYMFKIISFFHKAHYLKAKNVANEMLDKFPDSPYKDTALYYLGLSNYLLDNKTESILIFSFLKNSSNKDIAKFSRKISEIIALKANGDISLGKIDKLIDKKLIKLLEDAKSNLNILVVLPLTGKYRKPGKELLNGIKYFFRLNKQLLAKNKYKINLDVVNSENNQAIMIKKVTAKLQNSHYTAIIGELTSDLTASLAGCASLKKIPLIAPTASNDNISKISKYIYQLNTSSYTLGKKIAAFAIDSLKDSVFVTLAPMDEDGKNSTAGFIETITKKGGKILSQEWYYEPFDLNKQLTRIREADFKVECDTLLEADPEIVSKYMDPDSIKKVPTKYIDAIYLPIPRKDITSIISQVAFYHFDAKILGNSGFDDGNTLHKIADKIDSLIFIKESGFDINKSLYNDFVFKFRRDFKRNPNKLELIGYNTILFLKLALEKTSEDTYLADILLKFKEFKDGIYGNIYFEGKSQANSAFELYMFNRKGGIKKIDK